jgi:Fe-S cluster biosynthesis and repair protein YggX
MSQLAERISQFRKMAQDDPDNELGHFRLGSLLMEDGQLEEAARSFRRTLEISPQFSKVYQLLGQCLIKMGRPGEAVPVLNEGYGIAQGRGDNVPREEIAKLLKELGQPVPQAAAAATAPGGDGFRCLRPGCLAGARARQMEKPPVNDEIGKRIQESVCADCWNEWLRNYSIKVINELRLDLSTERDQEKYDQIMKEFLGLD